MRQRDIDRIYRYAKAEWGYKRQMLAAAEEFAELAAAMIRFVNAKCEQDEVVTELADVEIMCSQMRHYFSGPAIDAEKDRKLRGLAEKLKLSQKEPPHAQK